MPLMREPGVLGREPRQRRKSGGRQADGAGLAVKAVAVGCRISDWPSARSLFEVGGAALKLPPGFSIGLASGADCVDAVFM